MKRLFPLLAILLLLAGCSAKEKAPNAPDAAPAPETQIQSLWTTDKTPVSVDYYRMWTYSVSSQSDDPAILSELVDAIRAMEVGKKSEWVTEDYTDILTFRLEDGGSLRLEFENQCVVTDDGTRYEVDGLPRLRAILDELIGEQ